MDVKKLKLALGLFVVLVINTACQEGGVDKGNTKLSKPSLEDECRESSYDEQYIIKYKDGSVKLVTAKNDSDLIKNHVQPEIDDIEVVDRNIRYDIPITPNFFASKALAARDWGQQVIEAEVAWSEGIQGQGVTVAVIDAGVSVDHPLLKNRIAVNTGEIPGNGIDDDGNGYIDDVNGYNFADNSPHNDDSNGHGTHVAGIVASEHITIDGKSVLGVAPKAKILPIDFINNSGGSLYSAIQSIDYVLKMHKQLNIKVVNASWGGPVCSQILKEKIITLGEAGILFVAAAGNDNKNLDYNKEYPAAYQMENLITVGAITSFLGMASFSNYGDDSVDVFAPGEQIFSTVFSNSYTFLDGTSMAAPFVAGAAALIYSVNPDIKVEEVRRLLMQKGAYDPRYRSVTKKRLNVAESINNI